MRTLQDWIRIKFTKYFWKDRKINFTTLLILGYLFLLAFTVVMKSPVNLWKNGDAGNDSSIFRYVGLEMAKGGMPYRDSFDHKGPLIFIINCFGIWISYYRGVWLIELISLFTTLCFLYKTARMLCDRPASMAVVFVASAAIFDYFKGGNMTEEYAMLYIAVSLYIFLDYFLNEKISRFRLAVCGFSFAAVFLLRANMISLWIVFALAVLIDCLKNKAYTSLRKFICWFLAGACMLTIPILLWLALNGAFSEFIRDAFIINFQYSGVKTWIDKWKTLWQFSTEILMLFLVVLLIYQVAFDDRKRKFLNVTYLVYFLVSLVLISVSGRHFEHYAMILIPAMVYPLAFLGTMCEKTFADGLRKSGLSIFIIYFLAYLTIPNWVDGIGNVIVCYQEREENHHDGLLMVVTDIIQENTTEEDEITVYGSWDLVYLMSHRMSASVYSQQYSIGYAVPEIVDSYFEEITQAQPKIIVVVMKYMDERMEDFLDQYQYETIWIDEQGKVKIYKAAD